MDFQRLQDNWKAFLLDAGGIIVFFLIVQLGGVFFAQQQPTVGGGSSAGAAAPPAQVGIGTAILYLVLFLLMTVGMLGAIKYGKANSLRYLAYPIIYVTFASGLSLLGLNPILGLVLAVAAPVAYARYRTWYVVTFIGLVLSAVTVGAFGAIWSPTAILLLLAALTVYDIIAVYVTGHMQTLARGVGDKLPLFVVIPHSSEFTIEDIFEQSEESERVATALGLGDLIIPSTLVAIAAERVGTTAVSVAGLTLTTPAIGAMLGTLLGVVLLTVMLYTIENSGHAGLPPLNVGAIGGYLVGGLAAGLSLVVLLGL